MNLRKKGFQLPEKLSFDEDTLSAEYGKFVAEPFERGYGTTIGSALRRVLLSSIEGASVVAVKINGALHEFSSIQGVKEDVIDIILNLKKLRFRFDSEDMRIATFNVKGQAEVTGADLQCDSSLQVLNPELHITSLDKGAAFEAELYIRKGKGYVPAEFISESIRESLSVDTLVVDAVFTPIKKVNFWVEKARVGRSTDYDRLVMEIWTDGSITPEKAVSNAAQIIIEHFDLFLLEDEEEMQAIESGVTSSDDTASSFNENLLKNVDELELSVRSYNCLKNANIRTIAELVQRTEQEMLKTKNFGRKSLNEIKEIIEKMGLHLGMKIELDSLDSDTARQTGGVSENAS